LNTTMAEERAPFQQAGIRVEKLDEFEQLQSAIARAFAPAEAAKYLRLLERKNVPIRDFHRVLRERLLEQADAILGKSGKSAQQLYDALPVSDQAQMREFYLTTLESVDATLRNKFNKLYRYY